MTGSFWLVRPEPLKNESASSWRQRLAWANGYQLFPISDNRRRRCDPDIRITEDELRWLADLTLVSEGTILDLFISNKPSMRPLVKRASRHIPWVVHAKPVAGFRHGSMFCPECLKTDKVPYFRWQWRLGFMNACENHIITMLDRCPCCKSPPWPCGSGVKARIHPGFVSFLNCWNCGFDLGQSEQVPSMCNSSLSELHSIAESESVVVGDFTAPSSEALEGLRSIGHIFLRNRLREQIANSPSRWASIASALPDDLRSINMIENVSAKYRQPIVNAAAELLADWPHQFIELCTTAQITRSDFYGTDNLMPFWMQECVDLHLARQNRGVDSGQVIQVIEKLTTPDGTLPTKAEIKRYLGWFGEKELCNFNQKRTQATADEWRKFCDCIQHQLVLSSLRTDCRSGLLRDLLAIALCARDNVSSKEIALFANESFWGAFDWKEIEVSIVSRWGITPSELRAKVHGSVVDVDLKRTVRKRLRNLMQGLPPDLLRSPGVFRPFLFDETLDQARQPVFDPESFAAPLQDKVSTQLDLPF